MAFRSAALRGAATLTTVPSTRARLPLLLPAASILYLTRHSSSSSSTSGPFGSGPAPPRLPPDQQAEFERLVRAAADSAAAASLADAVAAGAAAGAAAAREEAERAAAKAADAATPVTAPAPTGVKTTPASHLNGNPIEGVWRGAPPEFEGDRNPTTGEVGGPKNEPLRWGSAGDWSYNGRVTDF